MPINIQPTQVSSYLQYLPAIFQEDADQQGVSFIGRFLLAFEKILSGLGDPDSPGLEEIIAGIDTYFKPGPGHIPSARTPDGFLPWLASWVALTLRADWAPEEQRRFLSRIVPLYRKRGTKAGLEEMLHTYTGMGVEIFEYHKPFVVGETSTVGVDTYIGGGPPHFFWVKMVFTDLDPAFERRVQIARAIIDQEKPAHTYYHLEVVIPTMQIGMYSKVGEDTLLGTTKDGTTKEKSQP
jgi:phage tail-like protein